MIFAAEIDRGQSDFYTKMGRFFGSRMVAKEVGIHIYDNIDKRWFVATDGESIFGFASLKRQVVSDCYVVPEKRMCGVFGSILMLVEISSKGTLKANCSKASKKAFANAGFEVKRQTKNFTYMELYRA